MSLFLNLLSLFLVFIDAHKHKSFLNLHPRIRQIFDREKMDLIKSIVFHVSKVDREDQFARDDLWVRCKMKIDKWNRDLRYRYTVSRH